MPAEMPEVEREGMDKHGVKAARGRVLITQLPAAPKSQSNLWLEDWQRSLEKQLQAKSWQLPPTPATKRAALLGDLRPRGALPGPATGTWGWAPCQSTLGMTAPWRGHKAGHQVGISEVQVRRF